MRSRHNVIRLRPHHLICARLFSGGGYSADFIHNLQAIIEAMESAEQLVEIIEGQDDVCAPCPYNNGVSCARDNNKVLQLDGKVSSILKINSGAKFKSHYIREKTDKALNEGLLLSVCNDCEWFAAYCYPILCSISTG